MADRQSSPRRFLGPWMVVILLVVTGSVLLIILNAYHKNVPLSTTIVDLLKAAIILVLGSVIARIIETRLLATSLTTLTPRQRTIIGFSVRLLLYLGIILAVLAGSGIGLSSFVFGGAFLTVIVGLAGQSMLSNLFGGIWLVLFQPFQVSDTISFVTWQYPLLMPSYPHDALKPAYTGRVTDINLMYTTILTEDGDPLLLPNGILAQSAIINKSRSGAHRVRVRFDVPSKIDPKELIQALTEDLGNWDRPPALELTEIGIANYAIRITLWSREPEDRVKDRALKSAWKVLAELDAKHQDSANPSELDSQ